MFGYSMVQMVRANAGKLDKPLRGRILNLYKPFNSTPCFFHKALEGWIKRRKKMSVVVQFEKGCHEAGCQEVYSVFNKYSKCKVRKEFSRIACVSADITPAGLEDLLMCCTKIRKVYLNREVQALLDTAVSSANAKNIVRNNIALTGKGIKIAIIDTGIYPHKDLSGRISDFVDFINGRSEPYDDNGHGTHCAGDAAGNGAASSGLYMGPAPEAKVAGVKVLNKMGSGSLETILQGVEWCIKYNENSPSEKIDIISMSLGSAAQPFENENEDPMVKIVEEAWASGIVVCVAAGNEGPENSTIASPGISDLVITVGALDDKDTAETRMDDEVASFSSRGPTIYGKEKPDILAPGVNIISLRSPNSYIDKLQKSSRIGSDYFVMSGTSMATPICAGIAALIKQHSPDATPQQIKDWLKNGADHWTDEDPNVYGAGYINGEKSVPE
ncbi:S8 family peptidase [Mesobacillus foraminis]|uniref:S8 family peptidase n=1 Tax=Mesobacillus foraminis TaxID=279826 RepID=UPI001BE5F7BD|nr:S8 family peptidase [Mesobacillus foraminis]MBT2755053.1 S8 family peptidase [Mesobacillus foraminis]